MGSTASLMWGILFGSIGMGYLVYGRRQRRGMALLSGIGLCIFPYFISNAILMVLVGLVLMILPYFLSF